MGKSPLSQFRVIDTGSRDEFSAALARGYGATDIDWRGHGAAFRGAVNNLPLRRLDLSYGMLSGRMDASFAFDAVRLQLVLAGGNHMTTGHSKYDVDSTKPLIIPPDMAIRACSHGGFELLLLRFPEGALRAKLTALIGRPVKGKIDFQLGHMEPTPATLHLCRLIKFFVQEFDGEGMPEMLQLEEIQDLLLATFLNASPHRFSHLLRDKTPDVAPWQVRVVEDYIEENWNRPLTVELLARLTGVSARAMFRAFKQARGYTPLSFLHHVRLNQARRMLLAPDEATTVMAVSLMCGFQNAGHFARYYQAVFRERPSQTLAAARGRGKALGR